MNVLSYICNGQRTNTTGNHMALVLCPRMQATQHKPAAQANLCSQAHGPEVPAAPALPNTERPAAPEALAVGAASCLSFAAARLRMNRKLASHHDSPSAPSSPPHLPQAPSNTAASRPPPPPLPHHHTHTNVASHKHLAVESQRCPAVTSHHTGAARGGGEGRGGGGACPLEGEGVNRFAPGSMAATLERKK